VDEAKRRLCRLVRPTELVGKHHRVEPALKAVSDGGQWYAVSKKSSPQPQSVIVSARTRRRHSMSGRVGFILRRAISLRHGRRTMRIGGGSARAAPARWRITAFPRLTIAASASHGLDSATGLYISTSAGVGREG
jgi:hypothetical protein